METERSKDRSGICKACEPDIAVASADGWAELLLPELDRLQARDIEVAVRGDAAFARPELYESLEERETRHAIRLPANGNLERRIAQLLKWPVGRPSHRPVVRYKSFFYQAASWKRARRVVAKVEFHQSLAVPLPRRGRASQMAPRKRALHPKTGSNSRLQSVWPLCLSESELKNGNSG